MSTVRTLFSLFSGLLLGVAAAGAIDLSATGIYTQNFDYPTLIMNGTASWTDNSTISGWFAQSGNQAFTPYTASTGSLTSGDIYSFGQNTTATDRALGGISATNVGNLAWGVSFTNVSGASIQFESISFLGEQWRDGGNPTSPAAQNITFSYQRQFAPISDLTPNSEVGWIQVPGLTFTSPKFSGVAGTLNGNLAGNFTTVSFDFQAANQLIFLSANQTIMFRWLDIDHPGTDHALAIDDVAIVYSVIPEPNVGALLPLGLGALAARRRRIGLFS